MTEKKHFKDKCDKCGKFAILKGVDFLGQCLCENCISSYSPPPEEKNERRKTTNFIRYGGVKK